MHTETDGSHMCIIYSDIANRDELNHEVDDILPVVLAWLVSFPYAARTVHYQYDVYLTCCNTCKHDIMYMLQLHCTDTALHISSIQQPFTGHLCTWQQAVLSQCHENYSLTATTTTNLWLSEFCLRLPMWAGTRKVKPNQSGFPAARDSEWQCNQLGHMQICTSSLTDTLARTPPVSFI